MIKVAINGYGRIGRVANRVILERHSKEIELVAINAGSSTDIKGWAYLLKYDTSYGTLKNNIDSDAENIIVDGNKIPVLSQKDPSKLPWKDLNVDVVVESTGEFRDEEGLKAHLGAGARGVVLSAPLKGGDVPTYILSVNSMDYKGEKAISNAS